MVNVNTNRSALKLQIVNKRLGVEPSEEEQMMEYNRTGAPISDAMKTRLNRIQKVWAMLCDGKAKQWVIETIANEHGVDERTVYNDIKASYEVYGSFDILEISGKLVASINFYEKIAQDAYQATEYEAATKARAKADDLLLELQKINAKKKTNPVTKWVFKPINAPEVIDVDYDLDE